MKRVCVIGEGAWGTAVANLLASNKAHVILWCYDHDVAREIVQTRYNNRYLPGIFLHENIIPVVSPKEALEGIDIIFEAVPVRYLRATLEQFKPYIVPDTSWVILSKGIEDGTFLFPSEVIDQVVGSLAKKAVLVGPSFARDIAEKRLTGVMLASDDGALLSSLILLLSNDYFKVYGSNDMIGIQICAAFKNVVALALGMLDGMGSSENTRAYVFTYTIKELIVLLDFFKADRGTIYGLAGIGDLVLTALSPRSKNYELGRFLAQGSTLEIFFEKKHLLPEGVNTAIALHGLAQRALLNVTLCKTVYDIIMGIKKPQDLVAAVVRNFSLE